MSPAFANHSWTARFFVPALMLHAGAAAAALDLVFNLSLDRYALDNLRFLIPPALTAAAAAAGAVAVACAFLRCVTPDADERRRRCVAAVLATLLLVLGLEFLEFHPWLQNRLFRRLAPAALIVAVALHIETGVRLRRGVRPVPSRLLVVGGAYLAAALNLVCWFHILRIEGRFGVGASYAFQHASQGFAGLMIAIVLGRKLVDLGSELVRGARTDRLLRGFALAVPYVLLASAFVVWSNAHGGRFHPGFLGSGLALAWGGVALLAFVGAWRWRFHTAMTASALAVGLVVSIPAVGAFLYKHWAHREVGNDIRNIVLITPDTLRSDVLEPYGGSVAATPALLDFAEDAVVFEDSSSVAPWTMPSFASLFTGLPPRVFNESQYESSLPRSVTLLAERLAAKGYYTGAVGMNHWLTYRYGFHQGFDDYELFPRGKLSRTFGSMLLRRLAPDYFAEAQTTDQLRERAFRWLAAHRNKPFFFWLHLLDPHAPYEPPPEHRLEGEPPPGMDFSWGPTEQNRLVVGRLDLNRERKRWIQRLYLGEVQYMDAAVGSILDRLRELGLYDSSLIIFTSDHGEEFWEHGELGHGRTLFEESLRVPLMIKLPGQTEGRRVRQPVSGISVTPTILDLVGVDFTPESFAAPSLVPLLTEDDPPADTLPQFAGTPRGNGVVHVAGVRFDRFKLIQNTDDSFELYDLLEDPGEKENAIGRHPDAAERGREFLEKSRERIESLRSENGIEASGPVDLTSEDLEHLERLGYL